MKVMDCIKVIQEQMNEINNRSNINLAEIQKSGQRLFDSILFLKIIQVLHQKI